ncbi:MAG: hypothetical protein QOJ81_1316 [Chloroflexota bacterium]|nr:hypothetical protein [Chloroflexota bacterium]
MDETNRSDPPWPDQDDPQSPNESVPPADQPALPIDPEKIENEDQVDEASDESFPASDPPSYSRSATTKD